MAITTRAQLITAKVKQIPIFLQKSSPAGQNQTAGYSSFWRSTGFPAQGAIPTTPAACTKADTGAYSFDDAATGRSTYVASSFIFINTGPQSYLLHDRLAHMGGLDGTLTSAQTVNLDISALGISADRIGATDYSDCQWWLEWYTATGSTSVTFSIAVTFTDATTGTLTFVNSGTSAAQTAVLITPSVAGKIIKIVNSVTLSASTGTAGNFGVTVTRDKTAFSSDRERVATDVDYANSALVKVANDACLFGITIPANNNSSAIGGYVYLVQG